MQRKVHLYKWTIELLSLKSFFFCRHFPFSFSLSHSLPIYLVVSLTFFVIHSVSIYFIKMSGPWNVFIQNHNYKFDQIRILISLLQHTQIEKERHRPNLQNNSRSLPPSADVSIEVWKFEIKMEIICIHTSYHHPKIS